jgi:hypothetical protein
MTQNYRSFLKKLSIVLVCLSVSLFSQTPAQKWASNYTNITSNPNLTHLQKQVAITNLHLNQLALHCPTVTCANAIGTIHVAMGVVTKAETNKTLTKAMLTTYGSIYTYNNATINREVIRITQYNGPNPNSFTLQQEKLWSAPAPSYIDAGVCITCDRTFATVTGICSLYIVASPLAGAICEGAAIYGYNGCLNTNQCYVLRPNEN